MPPSTPDSTSQSSLPIAPDLSQSSPISSASSPLPIPPSIPVTGSQVHAPIPTAASQVPTTVNNHSMITRSKVGIYKPKALLATSTALQAATKGSQPKSTKSGNTRFLEFCISVTVPAITVNPSQAVILVFAEH
nr:hypothetical protein CFP56_35339 [Quercus suber]